MVNVLIVENRLSEQILIQTYLPEYCVYITVTDPAGVPGELDVSSIDVLLAGPSVPVAAYSVLADALSADDYASMFVILSRRPGAVSGAGRVFKGLPGLKTFFSVFPVRAGLLKMRLDLLVSEKLKLISQLPADSAQGRMAGLVGESKVMNGLKADILRLATAPGPVLITGESGTGKEITAELVHDFSDRREKVFHALNAGAIPAGLSESELFGSEKGAFTGALCRKGCFELAAGGTLFLDEVGELGRHIQVELLRVLETGCIRKIGGGPLVKTDVRLIAATNRDLAGAVASGAFRQDLLFRINVFQIRIPPLREHKEDIPDLLRYFSGQLRRDRPDKIYEFSDSFIDGLFEHNWPGNVRELRNVFHRAVYASDSGILTADSLQFDSFKSG